MLDEVIYRCVNRACGKGMPRQVAFCPFCGTGQLASASAPRPAAVPVTPAAAVPVAAVVPVSPPAAPKPEPVTPPKANPPNPPPKPPPAVAPPRAFAEAKPAPPPPLKPVGMLTWLLVLIALAAIWYLAKPRTGGPDLGTRVDAALALASGCKSDDARAELARLKTAGATQAQLARLQKAIGDAAPACDKKRARAKAWVEAGKAVDEAIAAGTFDKAASRLATFVRRWGDDPDTLALQGRIEVRKAERLLDEADACLSKGERACVENRLLGAERLKRPEVKQRIAALREGLSRLLEASLLNNAPAAQAAPAAPASVPAPSALANQPPRTAPSHVINTDPPLPSRQGAQQARKIVGDAERELAQGNYRSAIDKLDICATMIDAGNRDCLALKQKAERLNREMQRCVANGADWIDHRCN